MDKKSVKNPVIEARNLLDSIAEQRARMDLLRLQMQEQTQALIPPEIRAKIQEIESMFALQIMAIQAEETAQVEELTKIVEREQVTIKGKTLMAVYSEGRVTWNGKLLEGFFATMPQLAEKYSKKGKPSVQIRSCAK